MGNKMLVAFDPVDESWKMEFFKERLQQAVSTIYIDIAFGKMNDSKKAKAYAEKVERVLQLPYFSKKEMLNKTVETFKNTVKKDTYCAKNLISFYDEMIEFMRREKLSCGQKFTTISQEAEVDVKKKKIEFYKAVGKKLREEMAFYKERLTVISGVVAFVTDNKEEINLDWKVSSLKKFILSKISEDDALIREGLENLSYFRQKKYLSSTVRELLFELSREKESLEGLIALVVVKLKEYKERRAQLLEQAVPAYEAMLEVFSLYDAEIDFYTYQRAPIKESYSLLRFTEGLIKANMFKSLYE